MILQMECFAAKVFTIFWSFIPDDSALALVMHTGRDDNADAVPRDETEIFVPGKGDLRSTQPDSNQDL